MGVYRAGMILRVKRQVDDLLLAGQQFLAVEPDGDATARRCGTLDEERTVAYIGADKPIGYRNIVFSQCTYVLHALFESQYPFRLFHQ